MTGSKVLRIFRRGPQSIIGDIASLHNAVPWSAIDIALTATIDVTRFLSTPLPSC